MSNTKRFLIILAAEFVLFAIGLLKVSVTDSNFSAEIPNFTTEYMLGYSIPIFVVGSFVFFCCKYILKTPKVVQR